VALDKLATKRKATEMRSAKNFHPERDYVSARSFLVAMAIGAIASGQVILSLVDVRIGQASVAVQTLAASAQALIGAPEAAKLHAQPVVEFAVVESAVDSGAPIIAWVLPQTNPAQTRRLWSRLALQIL
jgi:hypothetical protein